MLPPAVSAGRTIKARNGDLITIGRISYQVGADWWTDLCIVCFDPQLRLVKWVKQYNQNHPRSIGNWIEEMPNGHYLASGSAGSRIWAIEIDSSGGEVRRQTFFQDPALNVFDLTAYVRQAPGDRFIATGVASDAYLGSFSDFSQGSQSWGGTQPGLYLPPHVNQDGSLVVYSSTFSGGNIQKLQKLAEDSTELWSIDVTSRLRARSVSIAAFAYLADSSAVGVGYAEFLQPAREDFYFCRIKNVGIP